MERKFFSLGRTGHSPSSTEEEALIDAIRLGVSVPFPSQPTLRAGEARLEAALHAMRAGAHEIEHRTMRSRLGMRGVAIVGAGALLLGAAGTVGAAGGVSDVAGNVDDVLAALNVTDRAPDQADGHIEAIEQHDSEGGSSTGGDPNDNANDNADDADNADDGINNSNASDTGLDHASDNASEGSGNAEDGPSLPDSASDNAGEGSGNAENGPSLPDNANDHANEAIEEHSPPQH